MIVWWQEFKNGGQEEAMMFFSVKFKRGCGRERDRTVHVYINERLVFNLSGEFD